MLEGGDDESADEEISDVDEDEVEGENITILYTPSRRFSNQTHHNPMALSNLRQLYPSKTTKVLQSSQESLANPRPDVPAAEVPPPVKKRKIDTVVLTEENGDDEDEEYAEVAEGKDVEAAEGKDIETAEGKDIEAAEDNGAEAAEDKGAQPAVNGDAKATGPADTPKKVKGEQAAKADDQKEVVEVISDDE